ncbi:hypothetical protein HK101_008243 [Irineochytrium annulatum]|nr:hypothetical protein HK101_008243 [Irineochytrium annulatum]
MPPRPDERTFGENQSQLKQPSSRAIIEPSAFKLPNFRKDALRNASSTVLNALSRIPISSVMNHKRAHKRSGMPSLICVEESVPLSNVLKILNENNILAVPVYKNIKPADDSAPGREFIGIVSIYDVLVHTVFTKVFDRMEGVDEVAQDAAFERWMEIDEAVQQYFSTPVGFLVGYTAESTDTWTLHATDPCSSLLQLLVDHHRILVIDDGAATLASALGEKDQRGSSIRIVTQTDLMAFLMDCRDAFAPEAMTTLFSSNVSEVLEHALNVLPNDDPNQVITTIPGSTPSRPTDPGHVIRHRRVIAVRESVSALAAMRTMYMNRVSAVAVINERGCLVANLSASDLRGVVADRQSLAALTLPVFDFLEKHSHRQGDQIAADQLRVAGMLDPLGKVATAALASRVHRIWIVDAEDRPRGVVSFSDMLAFFVPDDFAVQG